MWDWIKKTAGEALQQGAQYLGHATFIEELLNHPDPRAALLALREQVSSFDETDYQFFSNCLNTLLWQAQQDLQNARQNPGGSSWGGSFEDQLAQFMAESQAGIHAGNSPAVQQAANRLQELQLVSQYARQFWQEARFAQPDPTPRPVANQAPAGAGHGVSNPAEEIELAQQMMRLDSQLLQCMPLTMPGQADESLLSTLKALRQHYETLLRLAPPDSQLVKADYLQTKIGQCDYFAGMTIESLRDDARALDYYEQALARFRQAGNADEIATTEKKIHELRLLLNENLDDRMQDLRNRLAQSGEDLQRVRLLIDLGYLQLRADASYDALDSFKAAEALLEKLGHRNPAGEDLATALLSSLQDLQAGTRQAGDTPIENLVGLRGLYLELYMGLAQACRDDDPEQADHYLRLAEQLDDPQQNADFEQQLRQLISQFNESDPDRSA